MEVENQNSETLKKQLNKTKRTMQFLTVGIIIMTIAVIFLEFTKEENKDLGMYATIILPVSLIIIMLDKKYKKIKAELDNRD